MVTLLVDAGAASNPVDSNGVMLPERLGRNRPAASRIIAEAAGVANPAAVRPGSAASRPAG